MPETNDPAALTPDAVIKLPEDDRAKEAEYKLVAKTVEEYDQARKFDKPARKQYAIDRRYAAGTVDSTWAVSTNLIGSYIDILVAYLYARNPDVRVRKAEQVDAAPNPDMEAFSKTMELVISRLWKQGRLKQSIRKAVRSALSCGPGWLKVIMVTDRRTDPQVQAALNDARDNLARIAATQKELADGEVNDLAVTQQELEVQIQGLEANVEVIVRNGLAIDFCPAESVQVSLDVHDIDEYLDGNWMGNEIYRPKSELRELFEGLTEEEVKGATAYYQKKPRDLNKSVSSALETDEKDAEQFTKGGGGDTDGAAVEFARVIEIWDRRDNMIRTAIEGVKCWAKPPFTPPQASTRFYPYFLIAFYEVDGERHPQSLSWREHKLQDEYAETRSSYRLARRRSIPGTLFNEEQVDKDNAKKLMSGVEQEFIGMKLTNPNMPLKDVFAEKPNGRIDPSVYDTQPVLRDMEKISGVQEAQQASVTQTKTATEAEIQQSGFAARSSADRDTVEDVLRDIAQYTGEVSLQALTIEDVQRIAGPKAFWPEQMDINDLLTMVEVDIEAGSTGKPNTASEREAWSVAMPLIMSTIEKIQMAQMQGNESLAQSYTAILRETLLRMGDRIDVDKFIPQAPAQQTGVPALDALLGGGGANPAAAPGAGAPTSEPAPTEATPGAAPVNPLQLEQQLA